MNFFLMKRFSSINISYCCDASKPHLKTLVLVNLANFFHSSKILEVNRVVRLAGRRINLLSYIYNHFHRILRLFDVLTNFLFITSETMRGYYF